MSIHINVIHPYCERSDDLAYATDVNICFVSKSGVGNEFHFHIYIYYIYYYANVDVELQRLNRWPK